MVGIESLSLTYAGAAAPSIDGVSLRVERGEFVTLLGPSGCGKTSTLRCVAGLETPGAGRITIGEATVFDGARRLEVPTHARDIAMVFQSYAVWPHMTVGENVAFPLEVARVARAQVRQRVEEALQRVGLLALAGRSATRLSGGQQQRVAIARALVRRSAVMLLDEPLSNLDAKLREQMRLELRQLIKEVGLTALYVTHDQEEALMLSDRIALMNAGRLVETGAPAALYLAPRTLFAATFLGAAEVFAVGRVDGVRVATDDGELALAAAPPRLSHVAIRPEAIVARQREDAGRPNQWRGTLRSVVFAGRQQQLVVELANGRRVGVLAPPTEPFRADAPVWLELPAERLMPLVDGVAPT
jgi:iron(III) transport system ATP-binding protein